MTIVVTRNAPYRYRGFLASCMLEIAPGVYVGPRMTNGVRERIWDVCVEWSEALPPDGGVLLTWHDKSQPSGQAIRVLGWARTDIVEHDGLWMVRRSGESDSSPLGIAIADS